MRTLRALLLVSLAAAILGCQDSNTPATGPATTAPARGSIEVTAKLAEVPTGAIFRKDLYDYATVLKYEVQTTHRGAAHAATIYVLHYNPFKPRSEAADKKVKDIGGNVRSFSVGSVHRLSLEAPADDFYMGAIVNKYFGQETGQLYWAVWTDEAGK